MAEAQFDDHDETDAPLPQAEDFAARLFTLVMTGLTAVILLMVIADRW